MRNRIIFFGLSGLMACLMAGLVPGTAAAQETETTEAQTAIAEVELRFADYEARLKALLKVRRLEEDRFVSDVMLLVRSGGIPVPMLESSFLWVRNNRPETDYPFVYFERVLRKQGELAEITIPPFDYSVYSQRGQNRRSN